MAKKIYMACLIALYILGSIGSNMGGSDESEKENYLATETRETPYTSKPKQKLYYEDFEITDDQFFEVYNAEIDQLGANSDYKLTYSPRLKAGDSAIINQCLKN